MLSYFGITVVPIIHWMATKSMWEKDFIFQKEIYSTDIKILPKHLHNSLNMQHNDGADLLNLIAFEGRGILT